MKKIEISLQRKIAAVAICIALAVVTCKALIESWTGEKIE